MAELERRIRAPERENADLREQRTLLEKSGRHLLRTPAMKMATIQQLAGQHAVRQLCRTLGVARSAYYAAQKKAQRPRARENVRLGTKARELFEASGRTYGSPRLAVVLRRAGSDAGAPVTVVIPIDVISGAPRPRALVAAAATSVTASAEYIA